MTIQSTPHPLPRYELRLESPETDVSDADFGLYCDGTATPVRVQECPYADARYNVYLDYLNTEKPHIKTVAPAKTYAAALKTAIATHRTLASR